jgi:hypothetical protein
MDDINSVLHRLVQVGTVMDVDLSKHRARVKFQDTGIISNWLHVLDTHPHIPDFDPATQETGAKSGGSGEASFASHKHPLTIKQWMPAVNDTVVCLYLPVWNSDGFVLGGIT